MVCLFSNLKGVWHEIFDSRVFSWISVPQAPENPIGASSSFYKNLQLCDSGYKLSLVSLLLAIINASVDDTGDYALSRIFIDSVTRAGLM